MKRPAYFLDGDIRITSMASPSWCPLPNQVKGYPFRGASSGRTRDDRSDSLRCHQEHRLEGEAGPLHRDHPTLAFEGRSRPHEVSAQLSEALGSPFLSSTTLHNTCYRTFHRISYRSPPENCRGKTQVPGTPVRLFVVDVPYGLAALIRACDLAPALLGIPGGGVQMLVPVDWRVTTL